MNKEESVVHDLEIWILKLIIVLRKNHEKDKLIYNETKVCNYELIKIWNVGNDEQNKK